MELRPNSEEEEKHPYKKKGDFPYLTLEKIKESMVLVFMRSSDPTPRKRRNSEKKKKNIFLYLTLEKIKESMVLVFIWSSDPTPRKRRNR
jgi:hypothetical protein